MALSAGAERLLAPLRRSAVDTLHVTRFLKGLVQHRAHPDDVYISSYPRSGTTWMQLLVHLVRGGDSTFSHISEVVPWFERSLSLGRATARDFAAMSRPRAFKSHLPYAWLPRGARYVYVHRDGRDVVVSYYYFYRSHLGFRGDFAEFYARFARGDLQYGSWHRHVRDWKRNALRPEVLLVSYESLQQRPEQVLDRLAKHCGVTLTRARAQTILDAASFSSMKTQESKFDHASAEPAAHVPSGTFVREGRVGAHREFLTATQLSYFDAHEQASTTTLLPELRLAAFLH